jgi:hypothetical protein
MKLSVRPADLDADREALIERMLQHLTPMSDGLRYDWLYRQNPDGQAQLWVLMEGETNAIVGSGGIVPRRMYVMGQEKLGGVLVDFWIHPYYRSLGPALQLQRACLSGIDAGPYTLYYDFPKHTMVAVYRRLGVATSRWVVRMTKLLSVERKLGSVGQIPVLGRSLLAAANGLLRVGDLRLGKRVDCEISEQTEACDEEFTDLASQVSPGYGVCVSRTASYLNWRFKSHFHHRYEMLAARKNGSLRGYILFLQEGETATIVDLFGTEDHDMKSDLVSTTIEILRKRHVFNVNAPCLNSLAHTAPLRKLGFFPRETHPVIVSGTRGPSGQGVNLKGLDVFLMDGDRDS